MSMSEPEQELIELVSREAGVPSDTVRALLDLERELPNLSARGAKRRLAERIEEVITAGLGSQD
jgi:hypothetical protein